MDFSKPDTIIGIVVAVAQLANIWVLTIVRKEVSDLRAEFYKQLWEHIK